MKTWTVNTFLLLAAAVGAIGGIAGEPEVLGRFAIGMESHFERNAKGELFRIENGQRLQWNNPAADERILQIENGATKTGFVPYAVTDAGNLYRGDMLRRSWTRVGHLPNVTETVSQTELFSADVFLAERLFWANGRTVWTSSDSGKSWTQVGELPDSVSRLVIAFNYDLAVFTRAGHVVRGPVIAGERGANAVWNATTELLPLYFNEQAYVAADGYVFADPSGAALQWRKFDAKSKQIETHLVSRKARPVEVSSATATTTGCAFLINRLDRTSNMWKHDNYWDINYLAYWMQLEMVLTSGPSNCVWSAPFDLHRMAIRSFDLTHDIRTGPPGKLALVIEENDFPAPQIRAIAFNVADPAYYKDPKNLTPNKNDVWAVVVQNSKNGGTACDAFRNAPTAQQAAAAHRVYLKVPLFGSDPYCPATSTSAIACTTTFASENKSKYSFPSSRLGNDLHLLPDDTSGLAECVLPDID